MIGFGILVLSFLGMEVFSWAFHKYVMHGALWNIHKTHHRRNNTFFELNDIFSLCFGSVAVILILLGLKNFDYRLWIGCGITLYGFVYFVLHDVLIHRRIIRWRRPASDYLEALARAHRDHHKTDQREGSVSFGLLWVPRRYYEK